MKIEFDEYGRSMIEMLGVLAIVGVLSVAGIAGYSKAMGRFKINKTIDQVSSISSGIKSYFVSEGTYAAIATTPSKSIYKVGLFPEDMTKACASADSVTDNASTCIQNAVNGKAYIISNNRTFCIAFTGLSSEACSTLASSDWGTSTGYKGLLIVNNGANLTCGTHDLVPTSSAEAVISATETKCKCPAETGCSIAWEFF